jgi:TrmH family RNA methyltransferase
MDPLDPASVEIVLVRPARPANVAAACRAMKNMGVRALRIVGRLDGLAAPEVRALAYGAWDVLDGAVCVGSLADAVAGSTLVVATSGRDESSAWTPRRLAEEGGFRSRGGVASIVFGPEATGLVREELALCHLCVRIPTGRAQPSLNLAQAVLVIAYELRMAALEDRGGAARAHTPCATTGELEGALADFREGGLAIGYLNPENPDGILAEWRRLLARAGPTPREVTLLRGLARQMAWAGHAVARGPRPSG